MIVGSTYFEDGNPARLFPGCVAQTISGLVRAGAVLRDDVALEGRRRHDFEQFCPGVGPGEAIATRFNPRLEQPTEGSASS